MNRTHILLGVSKVVGLHINAEELSVCSCLSPRMQGK